MPPARAPHVRRRAPRQRKRADLSARPLSILRYGRDLFLVRLALLAALLERRTEDVAKRRTGVGRTVLRDGFLLFADLARLDGERNPAARLVYLGDERVDLVADLETLGALVVAVAREVGTADEGLHAISEADLDAAVVHFGDRYGNDLILAQRAAGR